MTSVLIYLGLNEATFEVKGHSSYSSPDMGYNDVCISVSTLVTMFGRWMEQEYDLVPSICEDGHYLFEIYDYSSEMEELLMAMRTHFEWLSEQYPSHVKLL